MTTKPISNSASTGGAGTFFEQHVGAYWLAQLLVRGIPPVIHDCNITEVSFQTEHLGWNTDDFLITGQNGAGMSRKLAGQVKRSFVVSARDEDCKNTIRDFWNDFKNTQLFSPLTDRFVLVTFRGSTSLLEYFLGLLERSRAAHDGSEFEKQLATPGFIHAKSIKYCDELQAIVSESEGKSLSRQEIWPFLRVLHVLSLDLNSETSQTQAMLKTLLALTAEQDSVGAANATWNELLQITSTGISSARTYQHGDLPEDLRQRHKILAVAEHRALRELSEHSEVILSGIRTTIGLDFHLNRPQLVQQVIDRLEFSQLILISGAAGSGKSVIAQNSIKILAKDYFVFSFRAEEFAYPHLDQTLQNAQVSKNAVALSAILAGQSRKVLLIESIERLLEKSIREAFFDLLNFISQDPSWRVILTCRDYSTDLVRTSFFEAASIGSSIVEIPLLNDSDLDEVQSIYPSLARPLTIPALRRVLRTPYFLNQALQINWSEEKTLPQSEQELRYLFWRQIIRVDSYSAAAMPDRRAEAFKTIALRRAQSLDLYARCGDLNKEALAALRQDSLIVSPRVESALSAPAHDVLEDWAILIWIDEQYLIHHGDMERFSSEIGQYPALRRTYRKWVAELVENTPSEADALFQVILRRVELPAYFRDDTLISLLQSKSSVGFIAKHSAALFANNLELLRRVIHLLQTACVTIPAWVRAAGFQSSSYYIPAGPAWSSVLNLVQTHLHMFSRGDNLLLLSFIESWARGISENNTYPDGADSVAAIAYWVLPNFNRYDSSDQETRALKVIAKIPKSDPEQFSDLLQEKHDKKRNYIGEKLQKLILEELYGDAVARDLPDLTVSVAEVYLLYLDEQLQSRSVHDREIGVETRFGIKPTMHHGYYPASALRGPFLALLRYHPNQGLAFLISVFNHSADWYAHPRPGTSNIELPYGITLTFADGTSKTQWCNNRLWNLYRGTSTGPYALQSMLMALEKWLLDFAEVRPESLDNCLLFLLRKSDNAVLTAVVASVATAHPHISSQALLVLLRTRRCIQLDRARMVAEISVPSKLFSMWPSSSVRSEFFEKERKQSDALHHRSRDLEIAIANLQLGQFATEVHAIFDAYRAELPSVESQSETDRMWRLAIHRMDMREYVVAETGDSNDSNTEVVHKDEDSTQFVLLESKELPADLKEMVERKIAERKALNANMALLIWGVSVFNYEERAKYDPALWIQKLRDAQAITAPAVHEEISEGDNAKGLIAAVCIRDHWNEMSSDDQYWCVNIVCAEVEKQANQWDSDARIEKNRMSADRASAYVLPSLLDKSLSNDQSFRVLSGIATGATHPIDEVRRDIFSGIGKYLWGTNKAVILRVIDAISREAIMLQGARKMASSQPYVGERRYERMSADIALAVRNSFFEAEAAELSAYDNLDIDTRLGAKANELILSILVHAPLEEISVAAFKRLAETLVKWWAWDAKRDQRYERDYQIDSILIRLLGNFLFHTNNEALIGVIKPLLDAIEQYPDEVKSVLGDLISIEDSQHNTMRFWQLWDYFSNEVRRAEWLASIDEEHAEGREMISKIFLNNWWKDEVRHWRSLEGYAERIDALFQALPGTARIFESYVRFLYHIGEQSLPKAFIYMAKYMQKSQPKLILDKSNTIFMVETLLRRNVYTRPLELKREAELRGAIIYLLDQLVEAGSSSAYHMRDDFVTPISLT